MNREGLQSLETKKCLVPKRNVGLLTCLAMGASTSSKERVCTKEESDGVDLFRESILRCARLGPPTF